MHEGDDAGLKVIALGLSASHSLATFTETLVEGYPASFDESVLLSVALSRHSPAFADQVIATVCERVSPEALAGMIARWGEGRLPHAMLTSDPGLIDKDLAVILLAHRQAYVLYCYIDALSLFPLSAAVKSSLRHIQLEFLNTLTHSHYALPSFQQHARDLSVPVGIAACYVYT